MTTLSNLKCQLDLASGRSTAFLHFCEHVKSKSQSIKTFYENRGMARPSASRKQRKARSTDLSNCELG